MLAEIVSEEQAKNMQPLVLAQIGDSVQTLFVRSHLGKNPIKVNKLAKQVSSVVCAGSQFKTFKKIEESLTETEQEIATRARNTHIHSKAKNFSVTEYIYATALEALIGYLYITGQEDRLKQILKISLENLEN